LQPCSRKKNFPDPNRPARPRWDFDPRIPTSEWFERQSLDEMWNLQEAVETFVYEMEKGRFLTWEAVFCKEQHLPLTAEQQDALGRLFSFNDDVESEGRIHYIDGIRRPSKPWDEILNQIVPHLLIEPFDTSAVFWEVKSEGFPKLMDAVRKHGHGLSLPGGANSPEEVIPAELRHKLWLQACFVDLAGLGQEPEINLTEQPERINWFIEHLRKHKDSVRLLGLTLETMMKRVLLPDTDQPIFTNLMRDQLLLTSIQEPIAPHL
jgi:hypothetical protein